MNHWSYQAYNLLGGGLFFLGLPPFFVYTLLSGHYGGHLKERLGYLPPDLPSRLTGSPRIWLHAVSLGEMAAAGAIVDALRVKLPGCSVVVSTTTEHGRRCANQILGKAIPVIYGPLDFYQCVRRSLLNIRPHVLGFLETEIWPAWLAEAQRIGSRVALLNGRISARSVDGYFRFRPFFREVLKNIDVFSMISEMDAQRIGKLGGRPEKIVVNGNAKYDALEDSVNPSAPDEVRRVLNLEKSQPVFVAGSTREGEEEHLLQAFAKMRKEIGDLLLVLAPRHITRINDVAAITARYGFGCQRWGDLVDGSVKRTTPVVLIDTFGELSRIYSVGTIIFCGGSLKPLGGQNPLEAAVWGKVVFYGPSMEDFQDARDLLENTGSGFAVPDSDTLATKALGLYRQPGLLSNLGRKARAAVLKNRGAAQRHADVICDLAAGVLPPK